MLLFLTVRFTRDVISIEKADQASNLNILHFNQSNPIWNEHSVAKMLQFINAISVII